MLRYNPETFANLYETDFGQEMWRFLNEEPTVATMKTAARIKKTPVELIEEALLTRFSDYTAELNDRAKQMIGHMVKQVMTAHGYAIDQQNVKIPKGFFSRGTRYKHPDVFTFHAHRAGSNGRKIGLTDEKSGAMLPNDEIWAYWKSFDTGISARIGFGLEDENAALEGIRRDGYYIYEMPRLLRSAQ